MDIVLLLVVAYLLISFTALTDKFILTKALPHPVVYAFFISTIGLAALVLLPFGFVLPPLTQLGSSLIAGAVYTFAILSLYYALRRSEASRVFATAGSLGAVATFILSFLLLGERLETVQVVAFGLLIVGGIAISWEPAASANRRAGLWFSVLTAVLFGVSYTAAKATYTEHGFISGFVLIRVFAFLAALPLLLPRRVRQQLRQSLDQQTPLRQRSFQLALFGGQAASGVGFLILNYVISLSSAAIALAAQGLQYAFLFIATGMLSRRYPSVLRENISRAVVLQKVAALGIISLGLVLLAINQT